MTDVRKMPMAEYLKAPAVSASVLLTLLDSCPAAAWYASYLNPHPPADDDTEESDAGTIAHSILLEGSEDCVSVIDPNDYPTKSSGNVPQGWTNKEIRQARDIARLAGKIPVFPEKMAAIRMMVAQASLFLGSLCQTEPEITLSFLTDQGDSELSIFWNDDGVPCRIRPDRLHRDHKLIVDCKFTAGSAEPDAWGRRHLIPEGQYVRAAFYRRGIEKVFGVRPDYIFLVTETDPPYLSSLVGCDNRALELGAEKVERALRTWRECAKDKVWPGYPQRVCYYDTPQWLDATSFDAEAEAWAAKSMGGQP